MKTSAGLFLTDILPHKRKLLHKVVKNKVFGKYAPEQVFSELRKAGVSGIELLLPSFAKTKDVDILELQALLKKNSMQVHSVHQAIRFFTKTKLKEIIRLFDIAKMLDANVIVIHVQSVGKQIFDKEYIETLHNLQKKYGIQIGFENRDKHIISFLKKHTWHEEKFPTLMKQTNFFMTLDTTHLAGAGGDIIDFFKKNKERIVNIHISDYRPHFLNHVSSFHYKHMPLGRGRLPIQEFLKTLRRENYKGLVTMEMHTDLDGMCESARIISKHSYKSDK
jgi:sugar phosphate isomerase/epimerase